MLLTTDLASRGLDIADVDWIVQYQKERKEKKKMKRKQTNKERKKERLLEREGELKKKDMTHPRTQQPSCIELAVQLVWAVMVMPLSSSLPRKMNTLVPFFTLFPSFSLLFLFFFFITFCFVFICGGRVPWGEESAYYRDPCTRECA